MVQCYSTCIKSYYSPSTWILFHISFQEKLKPLAQNNILTKENLYEIIYSRKNEFVSKFTVWHKVKGYENAIRKREFCCKYDLWTEKVEYETVESGEDPPLSARCHISAYIPPASTTMYLEPGAKVLIKSPPFPCNCLSTERCLTNNAAASGSNAMVKLFVSIPAC